MTEAAQRGRSAQASLYRAMYYTAAWRRLRAAQLAREPWCRMCREMGRETRATIVDHRRPHRGDARLFFDPDNLDSLCKPHHDCTKQRFERGRNQIGVGADGWPASAAGGNAG